MKHPTPLLYKAFGVSVLLGLLISTQFFGNTRVSAAPEDGKPKLDYRRYNDLEDMVSDYHKKMNEIVNEKLTLFLSYDHDKLQEFDKPPKEIFETLTDEEGNSQRVPTGRFEPCEEKNTSAFCLAELLVREHFAFRDAMIDKRNKVLDTAQTKATRGGTLVPRQPPQKEAIQDILDEVGRLDTFVDRELDVARKTMDITLAAYNELHTAWPMHVKYKEIIKSLETYRDQLADLRYEIAYYPALFLDVTTASCQ